MRPCHHYRAACEWKQRNGWSGFSDRLPNAPKAFCGPDQPTLLKLTEVFESPVAFVGKYSDAVLDQAFWDVADCAFRALYDAEIDWALRLRLIRSFETVFRELFAVRCAPALGHRGEEPCRPLNSACYMWWDFNCWLAVTRLPRTLPTDPSFDSAMLETIQSVLAIDRIACQESALHGLGHWHGLHPFAVERIIDGFLIRQPNLPAHLHEYALKAHRGEVL